MKKRILTLLLTLFLLGAPSVLANDLPIIVSGGTPTTQSSDGIIEIGFTDGIIQTWLTDGIIMPMFTNGVIITGLTNGLIYPW